MQLELKLRGLQQRHGSEFGPTDQSSYTQPEYGREDPMVFRQPAPFGFGRRTRTAQNADMTDLGSVGGDIPLETLTVSRIRKAQNQIKMIDEHMARIDEFGRT